MIVLKQNEITHSYNNTNLIDSHIFYYYANSHFGEMPNLPILMILES